MYKNILFAVLDLQSLRLCKSFVKSNSAEFVQE